MELTQALKKYADESVQRHPGVAQDIMHKAVADLKKTAILDKAYKAGDSLPDISLPNAKGEKVRLYDLLKSQRAVLTFYRGGWCPYCNLELKAFQKALPAFSAKSVQLIAISPELPDHTATTSEKNEISFHVLSDVNNDLAKKMNLLYELPKELVDLYLKFGINLETSQGNTANSLPLAATYIIEQDGKISYAFLEEDYKLRADPEEVLREL